MGTRCDFYVGRGRSAEWLGSIAWDGNPREYPAIINAATEDSFRAEVKALLTGREDGTLPEHGWPWPWEDSATTDYACAFDAGKVWASCFGYAWFDPLLPDAVDDEVAGAQVAEFPDMTERKNETLGPRSGLLFIRSKA